MKRTSLLLGLTLLILGGGFYVYWSVQPPTPMALRKKQQNEPIPKPFASTGTRTQLQPGQGSWLKEFDAETGNLTRQFRATEYVPQPNGTVHVTRPEVYFYGANGQQIHLTGVDGDIVVKDMPDLTAKVKDNAPATPPSRGMLNHVTIEMFSATSPPGVPDEVMTTDNIQFDNDTLFITTEAFTDSSGATIPKDQVPVHVRGKYDFDGRGLTMRWNDRDGRLETLEIAHGEQLIIRDSSAFPGLSGPQPAGRSAADSMLPEMFASADPQAAAQAIKADKAPPTTHPRRGQRGPRQPKPQTVSGPAPYLAVFNDDVRITQGDTILATADRMEVDFLQKSEAHPTTAPGSTQPTTVSVSPQVPVSAIENLPSSNQAINPTQPATKPAQPPTIVKWTGKLTVVHAPPDRHRLLDNGDSVVSLFGRPVHIVRLLPEQKKRQEVLAAVVAYHTLDGSVLLDRSSDVAHTIIHEFVEGKADPVSTLITDSLNHVAGDHVAILGGEGHVTVPADENAPEKGNLDARWTRGAKVFLAGGAPGESRDMTVRQMDIAGNVDVEHPQLSMTSQALSLFFDPGESATSHATTQPASGPHQQLQLNRVLATTNVHTVLTDSEGKHQTIDGQQLELLTARGTDGQIQPRQVNVQDDVHAFDADQDLRTRRLELTLRPTTKLATAATKPTTSPSDRNAANGVELEKMLAIGDVVASSKENGSSASGDEMQVTMIDGEPHVRLTSASGNAKVIDGKKNIVTGPVITSLTKRQIAHVQGPGSVQATMADADGSNPRPVFVSWQHQADLNGPANTVDADGQIVFNTTDPDGRLIESHGDRVHVDLEEKPVVTTQPALAGNGADGQATTAAHRAAALNDSARAGASTKPGAPGVADANPMGQKQVKAVTLSGNAGVYSTQLDAQNHLLVAQAMEGETIIYQATGSAQQPARSIIVPGTGRMLLQDHRAAEQRAGNDTGSGFGNGRGDTAFKWEKQFVYSEDKHRAIMNGNVAIVYRSEDKKEQPVYINAAVVTAEFEPTKPSASTKPSTATRPTTRPGNDAMQLRMLVADADANSYATVKREDKTLTALQITYEPATHKMVAHGTPANPARLTSSTGMGGQTAEEITWYTDTWNVGIRNGNIQRQGRGR